MRFIEIFFKFNKVLPNGQQYIYSEIQKKAKRIGLHIWKPGDPIKNYGRRILIGVTEWNRKDLELLDIVCESVKVEFIEIFMLSDCKSQEDIKQYIPVDKPVYNPPVVGIWHDGVLIENASGWEVEPILMKEIKSEFYSPRSHD